MRNLAALAAASLACVVAAASAQQPATPAQQPTFRAGVDVIRLDVSVLDKNRRPVRGLTAADFTVLENGKPQRIVAMSEVDAGERDPMPTAWMRHVPRDVAANDLADQVGDGRLFGIILDDWNTPYNGASMVMSARSVARYVIDNLGPSDVAAVVFVVDAGKSRDFTDDRSELLAAVDRFEPRQQEWVGNTPTGPGPRAGDMAQQFAPSMARSRCMRAQPLIPAIDTVVSRLATVPNRRKTLIVLSPGAPFTFGGGSGCQSVLFDELKDVFWKAQRGNVNIHGVDPGGFRGYEDYFADQMMRTGRGTGLGTQDFAHRDAKLRHDFLQMTAENTGGRAVIDTDAIEPAIDAIFEEDGSYYLVGYETANGKPDGKFRKIDVKVNRPGTTVRSRSGYWATREGALVTTRESEVPTANDLGLTGMMSAPGLPLRVSVMPIGPAAASSGSRDVDVAIVLSVRLPAPAKSPAEILTVIRNVYDADGKPGPPTQESTKVTVPVSSSDAAGYDVLSRLRLAPGRYQLRLNAHSSAVDRSGSVFADLEVPDFVQSALTLSALALGAAPADPATRLDVLAGLLPIIPTSSREFAASEHVLAFLRIFQGTSSPPANVDVSVEILDVHDISVFKAAAQIPSDAFGQSRAASHQLELPLAGLTHGPYLLTITARTANGRTARRDSVFRVR
jgi:VWFA-related protein